MATVTKQIKKELQAFAERITPPNQQPGAQPGKALTADELKEKFGITTDRNGQPLKAGQLYIAKDLPAVNQLRRLCSAFERGGWPEVERYLQPYRTPEAIARVAAGPPTPEPVFEPLPEASADTVATELQECHPVARPCGYEAGAHACPCPNGCSNAAAL